MFFGRQLQLFAVTAAVFEVSKNQSRPFFEVNCKVAVDAVKKTH